MKTPPPKQQIKPAMVTTGANKYVGINVDLLKDVLQNPTI
jgi:hypothetical protein